MRPWIARCAICLLALLMAGCAGGPGGSCALVRQADMPIQTRNNLIFVPARFNGQSATLVLDTGAERTILTEAAVSRLHLRRDLRQASSTVGVGGVSATYDARPDDFAIGAFRLPADTVSVGAFSLPAFGDIQPDGLLGADILLAFDLDIDLPDRHLTIYRARPCTDTRPPWTVSYKPIAGVSMWRDRLLLPLTLNGAEGKAILDTGAQRSLIQVGFAARAGVTQAMLDADPLRSMRGASREEATFRLHRFDTIRIGSEEAHDVPLPVASLPRAQQDALIGGDFLHGRRIWLSPASHQVFITEPQP